MEKTDRLMKWEVWLLNNLFYHHLSSRYRGRHPLLVVLNLRNNFNNHRLLHLQSENQSRKVPRIVVANGNWMLFGLSLTLLLCMIKIQLQPSIPFERCVYIPSLPFHFSLSTPLSWLQGLKTHPDVSFFHSFFLLTFIYCVLPQQSPRLPQSRQRLERIPVFFWAFNFFCSTNI